MADVPSPVVHSIYDRNIQIDHARIRIFVNPIGAVSDKPPEREKPGCEGDQCRLQTQDSVNG
jgi:hypothetical protein